MHRLVVWHFNVNGGGSAVRRLPSGDTLINSKTEIQLVSPDKKVRWRIKGLQHFGTDCPVWTIGSLRPWVHA